LQAKVKADTVGDTFSDGEVNALMASLRFKTRGFKLGDLETESLVKTLPHTLTEVECETQTE